MELVIKIPEKEFGIDINDKFQDFFKRLRTEIKEHLISNTELVCGAYELETIEMFLNAFANATFLPKDHGVLIDKNALIGKIHGVKSIVAVLDAPIIIGADKAESKEVNG